MIYGQGTPGETHTITFTAKGVKGGIWENCAEMTSPAFIGTAMACAEGEVLASHHHHHDDDEDDDDDDGGGRGAGSHR